MRKIILVVLLLLVLLTACAKPEPIPPTSDSPISPPPPEKQGDLPAQSPSLKDNFVLQGARIVFILDELGNTYPVGVNLNSIANLPLFGNATLYLEFNKTIKAETIENLPQAKLESAFVLSVPLSREISGLRLPTTLTSTGGISLDREYDFSFNYLGEGILGKEFLFCYPELYPELNVLGATDFFIDVGETFLLVQNWPFAQDVLEQKVREAFSNASLATEWINEKTLAVTIKQMGTQFGWFDLSLKDVEDVYGYKHEHHGYYTFSLGRPKVIKRVGLTTGKETINRIPMAVSGATSMNARDNMVELYRRHQLAYIHNATIVHFWLELNRGKVVGEIEIGSDHSRDLVAAWHAVRPYLEANESVSRMAISPSGTRAAAIYYVWAEDKSYMLLVDLTTGTANRYPLMSQHPYDGGSNTPPPLIWSNDESKLIYNSLREEGIFSFNLLANKESKLVDVQYSVPLGLAPSGNTLLYSSPYTGYYVLDSAGNKQKLSLGDGYVQFVKWVDENSFLVNRVSREAPREEKCYLYNIKENRLEYISTGSAFDYDQPTGTVFILDIAK